MAQFLPSYQTFTHQQAYQTLIVPRPNMFPFQFLERFPLFSATRRINPTLLKIMTQFRDQRGAASVSAMEATCRRTRFSSYHRLVAISLGLLAVFSPLYIDRRPVAEPEDDEESVGLSFWLPLLLIVLIFTIAGLLCLERGSARFDAYWIHRVGGSSGGILFIIMVLAFVLKCKACLMFWES